MVETSPLTQCEAIALCFQYQYLRGAPLNDQYCIEIVIVAPYGAAEQAEYLESLLNNAGEITEILPLNSRRQYDVIVIALRLSSDGPLLMQPLRRYLVESAPLYGVARFGCPSPDVLSDTRRFLNPN